MDPDGRTLYAAAAISGVWKSTDAGHTWRQASNGLRTGSTAGNNALARDGDNPKRLLYATGADDGRIGHPYGGLYVSDDAAGTWNHVALCPGDTNITGVTFSSSRPFVATQCGLWTTAGATLATAQWTELSTWPQHTNISAMASGGNDTLFMCAGNAGNLGSTVYRIGNITSPSFPAQSMTIGGQCISLAPAPLAGSGASESVVALYNTRLPGANLLVYVLNFQTQQQSILALNYPGTAGGSGVQQVRTVHIRSASATATAAGVAYDVYMADGWSWWAYSPASTGTWTRLPGIHGDSWDMAFGEDYDPPNGVCTAYASTDGGVYANNGKAMVSSGGCVSGWVLAQSGLHALDSFTMAGIPLPLYLTSGDLFVPNGDNDVWTRLALNGGLTVGKWFQTPTGLGDAGQVLVDPMAPEYAQFSRGIHYMLALGPINPSMPGVTEITPNPANAPCKTSYTLCSDAATIQFPGAGGIAAVLTLHNNPHGGVVTDVPLHATDFVAVALVNSASSPIPDMVVRCRGNDCTGQGLHWTDVSPSSHFNYGIAKVLAAGGHTNPVLYVLTPRVGDPQSGQIWRGTSIAGSNPPQVSWTLANGVNATSLKNPVNFFANPYVATELYAVDAGDNTVKVSLDSGGTWNTDPTLTQFATNSQLGTGNVYRFDCNQNYTLPAYPPYHAGCVITGMTFDPYWPNVRVATSEFGGLAFSRDAGRDWMALNVTNNVLSPNSSLTQEVSSAFWEGSTQTIYAALHGSSMMSVAGPFLSLEQMTLVYPPSSSSSVNVVVSPIGVTVGLQKNSNGSFSGTLLFDSQKYAQLTFDFQATGFAAQQVTHVLTAAELSSGVATTTCTVCAIRTVPFHPPH
jgi:hypothetical protein